MRVGGELSLLLAHVRGACFFPHAQLALRLSEGIPASGSLVVAPSGAEVVDAAVDERSDWQIIDFTDFSVFCKLSVFWHFPKGAKDVPHSASASITSEVINSSRIEEPEASLLCTLRLRGPSTSTTSPSSPVAEDILMDAHPYGIVVAADGVSH